MKKILIVFLFLSLSTIAQTSEYNKNLNKVKIELNSWFLLNGSETFATKPNPVGLKESYDELIKVLSFYGLNISEPEVDVSLISKNVEDLTDFERLSISISIEFSKINMVWKSRDDFQINWVCDKNWNYIIIQKIKK